MIIITTWLSIFTDMDRKRIWVNVWDWVGDRDTLCSIWAYVAAFWEDAGISNSTAPLYIYSWVLPLILTMRLEESRSCDNRKTWVKVTKNFFKDISLGNKNYKISLNFRHPLIGYSSNNKKIIWPQSISWTVCK